ncbi:MAG: hypothetical protein R3C01_06175 [Planctomycetaceae bacterium]
MEKTPVVAERSGRYTKGQAGWCRWGLLRSDVDLIGETLMLLESRTLLLAPVASLLMLFVGCGGSEAPAPAPVENNAPSTSNANSTPTTSATNVPAIGTPTQGPVSPPTPMSIPKISLSGNPAGSGSEAAGTPGTASNKTGDTTKSSNKETVLAALQPLQILRDQWQVIQRKKAGTSDALQQQEWIWDFKTNRSQPAIVMSSPVGEYILSARVTFDPATEKYVMTAVTPEGETRTLEGEFSEPVTEITGDDNKPQRTYKLQFQQVAPETSKDQWQIVVNQQQNNRYLMEFAKKRGSNYFVFDTLGAQRLGTSFALSDTDYGDRTCVVSGGLGTAAVSFEGKTFYVCCSGCRAAFDEEPKTWIADFDAKMKAKDAPK